MTSIRDREFNKHVELLSREKDGYTTRQSYSRMLVKTSSDRPTGLGHPMDEYVADNPETPPRELSVI